MKVLRCKDFFLSQRWKIRRRIRITREKEDNRSVNVRKGIFLGNGKEKEKRKKNGDLVEIPQRKKK